MSHFHDPRLAWDEGYRQALDDAKTQALAQQRAEYAERVHYTLPGPTANPYLERQDSQALPEQPSDYAGEHDVCPLCSGSGSIQYGPEYDAACKALATPSPTQAAEPPFVTAMINARRERYALDQSCTPAFLQWLDTMTPREGVGANEAWNAGVEWQKSQAAEARKPSDFDIEAVRNQLMPSVYALQAFERILAAAHGIGDQP